MLKLGESQPYTILFKQFAFLCHLPLDTIKLFGESDENPFIMADMVNSKAL
jgi:hypothetical protein